MSTPASSSRHMVAAIADPRGRFLLRPDPTSSARCRSQLGVSARKAIPASCRYHGWQSRDRRHPIDLRKMGRGHSPVTVSAVRSEAAGAASTVAPRRYSCLPASGYSVPGLSICAIRASMSSRPLAVSGMLRGRVGLDGSRKAGSGIERLGSRATAGRGGDTCGETRGISSTVGVLTMVSIRASLLDPLSMSPGNRASRPSEPSPRQLSSVGVASSPDPPAGGR